MLISKGKKITKCPICDAELTADYKVYYKPDGEFYEYFGCDACVIDSYADDFFILEDDLEEADDGDYKFETMRLARYGYDT